MSGKDIKMDKILSNAMEEKKKIISEMDSIILSTVDLDGNPNSSYAPTAIDKDGNFYIYISKLSKHTQNLLDNDKVSFMIIEDECKAENLFARRRLTINSKSEEIIRDTLDWNQKIDLLEKQNRELKKYLSLHQQEKTQKNYTVFYKRVV